MEPAGRRAGGAVCRPSRRARATGTWGFGMERVSRSFGDLLHHHRLAAGLTQHDLARSAEVSVRALRDIEQHRVRRPHARSVDRLASALGLTGAARDELVAAAVATGAGQ